MHYRIEFLDRANAVVNVRHAEATSPATAFLSAVEKDWPPDALTARVVDKNGRRVSVSKPQSKLRPRSPKRV
jgi:hypothetical protein